MRIFLDANVLFSAAKSDGAIRALVERLLAARHECRVDAYVIEEARRNILTKQPSRVADMETLVARLQVATVLSDPDSIEVPEAFPEKDRPVLAAAVMLGCQALITGDRSHFGPFYGRSVLMVTIHSPRSLFEHLFGPRPTDSAEIPKA
jgi:predicted nucleic acid-binding protein